jgi:hypothetical protein
MMGSCCSLASVHPAGKSRHKLFTIAHDGSKLAALVFPTVFDSLQLSFQAAAIVFRTRSGRIKDAARARDICVV